MGQDERAAFERLVVEHIPAALRVAIRICGDAHGAEDVVQEALLRAAKGHRSFRGEAKFSTWLFRIVINAARDWQSAKPQAAQDVGENVATAVGPGPVTVAEGREFGVVVADCVARLPARQREVLVLSSYEGFSTSEIALVVGISEQNVRTTLHLARQRMRASLARYGSEASRER
jgi:RNA polymerase sigma-70 factor (ECF subfamily)